MIKNTLSRIQKYIAKYKIFRPYLKYFLQENGYITGYLILMKMVIGDGLRSIYRQLITIDRNQDNNQYKLGLLNKIVSLKDVDSYTYVIVAPNFLSQSAGVYCLYKLCDDLTKKGYKTAMYGTSVTPSHLDVPIIINHKVIKELQKKNNTWAIYPETVVKNPLNFKNVARWVLNKPGFLGGEKIYDTKEKVFVYSNVYASYVKNEIQGKLFMPTFDKSIFYPPHQETQRTLACYYLGKSTFKEGYFDVADTFEITRLAPAKKELGKLLRSAKVLYCFDNSTALVYEAIACGCPVQIIPDGTQTWEDYEKLEWGTTGIFWDKPAIPLTLNDVNNLFSSIQKSEDEYQIQLDRFIQSTIG